MGGGDVWGGSEWWGENGDNLNNKNILKKKHKNQDFNTESEFSHKKVQAISRMKTDAQFLNKIPAHHIEHIKQILHMTKWNLSLE